MRSAFFAGNKIACKKSVEKKNILRGVVRCGWRLCFGIDGLGGLGVVGLVSVFIGLDAGHDGPASGGARPRRYAWR